MLWSASQLSRHCAHHRILSNLGPPKPTRDKAAAKGTAFHSALAMWHQHGLVPETVDGDVNAWLKTMVDNGWAWPDGAELETAWGLSMWGTNVAVEETEPHVYKALDGEPLLTAGRADACWMSGDILAVIDWKTGRTQADLARINLQVNAAGIALCQRYKASAYQPGIYYAREGRWDIGGEVERHSPEWFTALEAVEAAAQLDDQPHPGDHCGSCWERKACSAVAP